MNHIKEIFAITNRNISLATPLILYSLFTTIYLAVSAYGKIINIIFVLILFSLMTVAFSAGWFYSIKSVVTNPLRDMNSVFKIFAEGVGEYFMSFLGAASIILVIYTICMISVTYAGIHFIGNPELDPTSLSNSLKSTADLKLFLSNLSAEQLSKLGMWNLLVLVSTSITNFMLMLYFPALLFKNKNPLKAFAVNLRNLFSKKFILSLLVYMIICILYFISSVIPALISGNVIVHLIMSLINFYFIVFAFIGIFYYYYHTYVEPKNGQIIDMKI